MDARSFRLAFLVLTACVGEHASSHTPTKDSKNTSVAQVNKADTKPLVQTIGLFINLSSKGDDVAFDQNALQVPFGYNVNLTFFNKAKPNSEIYHNIAILKPGTVNKVVDQMNSEDWPLDEIQERAQRLPEVITITKLLKPGETESVNFTPDRAGVYEYVCLVPNHISMGMKGVLRVSEWSYGPSPEKLQKDKERQARIQTTFEQSLGSIMQSKCYNCHSDKPEYPWYHRLPIIGDMIEEDVSIGQDHLNFSLGFPFRPNGAAEETLTDMRNVIQKNLMPPLRYRVINWGHTLDSDEKKRILNWVAESEKILNQ